MATDATAAATTSCVNRVISAADAARRALGCLVRVQPAPKTMYRVAGRSPQHELLER
jgi:hypothetical protein